MPDPNAPAEPPKINPAAPGLSELFFGFAKCSISGFGGTMPFVRRMIVEERRWMTAQEFNEAFALSHFLPGPNIVNFSVVFGSRLRGAAGAGLALLGLLGPPFLVISLIAALYALFGELDSLRRILTGVGAAAAGLVITVAIKMMEPVLRHPFRIGLVLMALTFVAIGILRWPLPQVLGVLAPVNVVLAYFWARR
ncbi:MAG: chromate transporter [Pseudorhodoplanes sp.]